MAELSEASSLKRRLLSGGAWALAGRVGTSLGQLAINALLARLLSPQDLGAYFLAFSVVTLGAIAGALGMSYAGIRFVAESLGLEQPGRARQAVGLAVRVGGLGSLCIGLLYLPFGDVLGAALFRSPALAAVTGLVAGWMVTTTLQGLLGETFRGFHDIRQASLYSGLLTAVLLTCGLGFLWVARGQTELATVLLLATCAGLANALLAGWALRRKVVSLPRRAVENPLRVREVLRVAGPLLVTNLTLFALTQADLWIMGAFRAQEEVAVYGAAARLVILVGVPLLVANAVLPGVIAELYAQGRIEELQRTLRATATLAAIPASLALLAFVLSGGPILGLVYGDYYRGGATVLALLSLGQLVSVWAGSCGLALGMTGHQSMLMLVTLVCGVLTIAVGLAIVGSHGSTGIAAAAAAGLALQNVLMWLGARATTGAWTHVGFTALSKLARSSGAGSRVVK